MSSGGNKKILPADLSYSVAKKVCSTDDVERLACAFLSSKETVNVIDHPILLLSLPVLLIFCVNRSTGRKLLANSEVARKPIVSRGRFGSSARRLRRCVIQYLCS